MRATDPEEAVVRWVGIVRLLAKGDNAISICPVRCTRKIGRWLAARSWTNAVLRSDGRTRPRC